MTVGRRAGAGGRITPAGPVTVRPGRRAASLGAWPSGLELGSRLFKLSPEAATECHGARRNSEFYHRPGDSGIRVCCRARVHKHHDGHRVTELAGGPGVESLPPPPGAAPNLKDLRRRGHGPPACAHCPIYGH